MSKSSDDLLRDEIKIFNEISMYEDKIKFINNRLLSLSQIHIKHHTFFKKIQIIINDIPKIDYAIKNGLIKDTPVPMANNYYEYDYYFKDDTIDDKYFYYANKKQVIIYYNKKETSNRFNLNTKYGKIHIGDVY